MGTTTIKRFMAFTAVVIGMLAFAPRSQALSQLQIDEFTFFANNFRSLAPTQFAETAASEGFTVEDFDQRLQEFAIFLSLDPTLFESATNLEALQNYFLYYHGEIVPMNPQETDIDGYIAEILKLAVQEYAALLNDESLQSTTNQQTLRIINSLNVILKARFHGEGPTTAGEISPEAFLQNAQIRLGGTYGWVKDGGQGGSGTDQDVSLFATAGYGDDWMYGIGLTVNHYEIDSNLSIDQTSILLDLFVTRYIAKGISVGAFFNYTNSDLEKRTVVIAGSPISFGGTNDRIGAGLLVNGIYNVHGWDLSATTTIASMNKSTVGDLFKDTDTVWITQGSVGHTIYEKLTGEAYLSWIEILDNGGSGTDKEYANIGFELSYPVTEHLDIGLGFQKGLFQERYEDNRLDGSLTYSW